LLPSIFTSDSNLKMMIIQKFDLCVIGLNSYTSENDLWCWLSIYSANVKRRFETFAQAVVHLA
jgi:hypothetical protein